MKIKFTQNYEVKDGSGKVYNEGDVEDFVDPSARHFLNRGVAVEVPADRKPKTTRKVAPAAPATATREKPATTSPVGRGRAK